MRRKLLQHWFLMLLAVCFVMGYGCDQSVEQINRIPLIREIIVLVVMLCMSVTLPTRAIRHSLAKPTAAIVAIASNVLLVPAIALPCYWWLPESLFRGMVIASLVPCTLASASVWTRRAGGDESVAIITTVVTNMASIMVLPIGLMGLIGGTSFSGAITPENLVVKLGFLVLVPIAIGQFIRWRGAAGWADRHKPAINVVAQLGILMIVVFGAARSAQVALTQPQSLLVSWPLTIGSATAVHLVSLIVAIGMARRLRLDRDQQIACGIAGSQKTLMIGLQVAIDCGASVLPMLVYHAIQLVLDTIIANRWRRSVP